MNIRITCLTLALCLAAIGCSGTPPGEAPKVTETGDKTTTEASEKGGRQRILAPWIASGYAGTITPTMNSSAGPFYGVAHGEQVSTKDGSQIIYEQWVLASADRMAGAARRQMKKFPNCLPLAEGDGAQSDTFHWHWGYLPGGTVAVKMDANGFLDYVRAEVLDNDLSNTQFVAGLAHMNQGMPPAPNDGDIPAETCGVVQSYSIGQTNCRWSVWAKLPEALNAPESKGVDEKRRVVQAWYDSDCKITNSSDDYRPLVSTGVAKRTKYKDWYDEVSTWKTKRVWSADGMAYIDRNGDWEFPGFDFESGTLNVSP